MAESPIQRKRARFEKDPVKGRSADLQPFPQCNGKKDADLLKYFSSFVSRNKGKSLSLKNPSGARLKIGDLNDTIYSGNDDKQNGWGQLYLPKVVSMQVIGVAEGTSYLCEQLVLMTCEDEAVYGYDGEYLHLVASSHKQLQEKGITYPSTKKYYRGQAFRDMDDVEWAKVRKRLDKEHQELVTVKKDRILKNLRAVIGVR